MNYRFVFAVLFLLFASAAAASDNCQVCYSKGRLSCERRCAAAGSGKEAYVCSEKCLAERCKSACGYEPEAHADESDAGEPSGAYNEGELSCEQCLRQAEESSACARDCEERGEARSVECKKRCAKKNCNAQCELPNRAGSRGQNKTTADCSNCKRLARMSCAGQCGKDKERPGYVACEVSCAEQKCGKICYPNAFR